MSDFGGSADYQLLSIALTNNQKSSQKYDSDLKKLLFEPFQVSTSVTKSELVDCYKYLIQIMSKKLSDSINMSLMLLLELEKNLFGNDLLVYNTRRLKYMTLWSHKNFDTTFSAADKVMQCKTFQITQFHTEIYSETPGNSTMRPEPQQPLSLNTITDRSNDSSTLPSPNNINMPQLSDHTYARSTSFEQSGATGFGQQLVKIQPPYWYQIVPFENNGVINVS